MKKNFNKRLVIILGFLLSILVFLSVIFIYVYKNILISNNKPEVNLHVFNKDDENIELQPEQKFVLDPRKLRTKINYVYGQYYFDNIRFHYYFLKCWIPQMMFFHNPISYLSFYYSNEKISYSKAIFVYHYHNEQQLY
ncbi:hypothetical protein C6B38_09080 [Spiroplasma sp. ChiS]|uniref:hypothetical protein n=1 Tax=Spiroplasma sp. ChiS TaxID=2099885 RepID=UPI000CF8A82B|nr:hypothetical protein [Spiroplasma sp. ChiS]PQP77970.1 hypothetical protein C6B38_09080 [Spiroplasma sp. ChiS]